MGAEYRTIRLKSWNDYRSLVDQLSENWVFRGQANSDWGLETAIERTDFIKLYKGVELDFIAEFQRGARNYLSRDEMPGLLIEWLALMQHHGAPTRLLDFTKSPFIGAYFAFEICQPLPGTFISIWAINIHFLKVKSIERLSESYREELRESNNIITENIFEKIFHDNSYSLIFPVEPFRMNRRYSLQQSIFVSTGNSNETFMKQLEFLGEDIQKAVLKIELPAELKKPVMRDLQKMNLHRASLFPDLDGYAASMRHRYNSMRTPEEILTDQLGKLADENYKFLP